MNFQPGDLQLLNNYVIMHARTAFMDFPDAEHKRDLIRLWLILDRDLGLPKALENRGLMPRSAALRA
jgi:hypothetical protein